jgi:hypothetical protein
MWCSSHSLVPMTTRFLPLTYWKQQRSFKPTSNSLSDKLLYDMSKYFWTFVTPSKRATVPISPYVIRRKTITWHSPIFHCEWNIVPFSSLALVYAIPFCWLFEPKKIEFSFHGKENTGALKFLSLGQAVVTCFPHSQFLSLSPALFKTFLIVWALTCLLNYEAMSNTLLRPLDGVDFGHARLLDILNATSWKLVILPSSGIRRI